MAEKLRAIGNSCQAAVMAAMSEVNTGDGKKISEVSQESGYNPISIGLAVQVLPCLNLIKSPVQSESRKPKFRITVEKYFDPRLARTGTNGCNQTCDFIDQCCEYQAATG